MLENRLLLRVWSKKAHKYLTDADIWDIFDSDAEDVWELLSEVNRPTTKFLEQQLREYKLTFEQCTELRDKNDKLIYEGDIVDVNPPDEWSVFDKYNHSEGLGKKAVVEDHGAFLLNNSDVEDSYWLYWAIKNASVEIIGNIRENPELLEE